MEIERIFRNSRVRSVKIIAALCVILVFSALISVYLGAVKLTLLGAFDASKRDILNLRLARIILAILTGGGLSVVGVMLQGLLRNPLCEPYVLGISSGASLGAVLAIVSGINCAVLNFGVLPLFAFLGAAAALFLVYRIAQVNGRLPAQNLLLTGVVMGTVLSSIVILIISFSQKETIHSVIWWMLGSLQIFEVGLLSLVGLAVLSGLVCSFMFYRELNAISLGEEEALHLGIDTERLKKYLFLTASLVTGAIVSVVGMIGFVGLIVPHFMRLIVGPDHRILIPSSFLAGGIFLVVCDSIARVAVAPSEIPAGAITAILGGVFFIYLLRRKSRI